MPDISRSVGNGAWNDKPDVKTVQGLLNGVAANLGGPASKLTVDGAIGPKTLGAISHFQVMQLGWGDGRVDPGKATIQKLNNPGPVVPMGGVKPQGGSTGGGGTPPDDGPPGGGAPIIPGSVRVVGVLSGVSGAVQVSRRWMAEGVINGATLKGMDGLPLQENDSVTSRESGRATINLTDGNRIVLGPADTLVVLYPGGPIRTKPGPVIIDGGEVLRGLRVLGGWTEN